MKIEAWVMTTKVGSESTTIVDVPDEDLEGLDEQGRREMIDSYAYPAVLNLLDWGWREEEG